MKFGDFKAHLALLAVNFIYGANYVIIKLVAPEYIKPFGLVLIRVVVAMLLFWAFHAVLKNMGRIHERAKKITGKDFLMFAVCALFGIAINQSLFLKGVSMTSPVNASLIMITVPIMALVFAFLLLGERITPLKALGIAMGASGAALIIWYSGKSGSVQGNIVGDIFVFVNACSYAFYLVLVKPLIKCFHPITLIKWLFLFAFFYVLPIGYGEFVEIEWEKMTATAWLCAFYVVFAATFLTYLLNLYALSKVNVSVVGAYIYLQPVIATGIAIMLRMDVFSGLKMLAAMLIFIGVYFVSGVSSKPMQTEQPA